MRVFAGPNGSGKSTTIEAVKKYRVEGRPIDLGVYVNADDIARELKLTKRFDFTKYGVTSDKESLRTFAPRSPAFVMMCSSAPAARMRNASTDVLDADDRSADRRISIRATAADQPIVVGSIQ